MVRLAAGIAHFASPSAAAGAMGVAAVRRLEQLEDENDTRMRRGSTAWSCPQ